MKAIKEAMVLIGVCVILFNYDHVSKPETVATRRWMGNGLDD